MGLTDQYSGIVVNQNAMANGQYDWRNTYGGNWIYQTFSLPSDYTRGTIDPELRIPDLSGLQVQVSIDQGFAASAAIDYVLQYYVPATHKWITLTNGTVIGAHADDLYVWYDIIFTSPVPIPTNLVNSQFRFGLQTRPTPLGPFNQPVEIAAGGGVYLINGQGYPATLTPNVPFPIVVGGLPAFLLERNGSVTYFIQQGVDVAWYTTPTPLVGGSQGVNQAYQSDGITPLLGVGTTASLNFRVLGLVGDSGTDFLNNAYRSCVVHTTMANSSVAQTPTAQVTSNPGTYWMSPPSPSRFAVASVYADVRPVAANPTFGTINSIGNPSFEYDPISATPAWWQSFVNGGLTFDQTVRQTWAYDQTKSLHMQYSFSASNQQRGIISDFARIAPRTNRAPTPISISLAYNLNTVTNCNLLFSLLFYDHNQNLLPSPYGTQGLLVSATTGSGTASTTITVPASTIYVRYLVSALSTGIGVFDGFVDAIQATFTSVVQPYFDGDDQGCQWVAQRGQSPSAQLIDPTPDLTNTVVIDGVLIDPLTPNMTVNVYYTQDDAYTNSDMGESDWERKLWTRVPQTYLCTQRQQYMFPQPIQTKYMKVEFTNLQAQSYYPGNFQKPTRYKKFPSWVANHFINNMELPSFVASQVNVQYDALSFAYDYYLDDLTQAPDAPTAPGTSAIDQLTTYFKNNNVFVGVDPTTLGKINLDMKPFQSSPGTNIDKTSTLGTIVTSIMNGVTPPPASVEGGVLATLDYSTVSSLQRDTIVFDQSLPPMSFFLTCRHGYKELAAPFEHNRAYFAGIQDLAFLRHDYTVAADLPMYVELGADSANMTFTDWVIDPNGNWYTYDN